MHLTAPRRHPERLYTSADGPRTLNSRIENVSTSACRPGFYQLRLELRSQALLGLTNRIQELYQTIVPDTVARPLAPTPIELLPKSLSDKFRSSLPA